MFVTPYKDAAFSFRAFVFLDACWRVVGYTNRKYYLLDMCVRKSKPFKIHSKSCVYFFRLYPCIVDFIKYLLERSWLYPMKNTRKYSNTNSLTCVVWKHFRFYRKFRMFFFSYRKCLQCVDKRSNFQSNGKPISFVAKWFEDNIHFLTV